MKIVYFLIFSVMFGGITLNAYGESIDEMHDSALEYMNAQNFVQAVQEYSKILEVDSNDETALINRAFAFSMTEDHEAGIDDLTRVLENDPKNLIALKGKATLLAKFSCESYNNCRPLEALELFEIALEDNPNDKELKMKRDFMLVVVSAAFKQGVNLQETSGEYIVNIQHVTRDANGTLVSVVENARTSVIPIRILEDYLDEKKDTAIKFKKEIVNIEGDDYIKWHFEREFDDVDKHWKQGKKFYGEITYMKEILTKSPEGYDVRFDLQLLHTIIPAQNVDSGYNYVRIVEVFKKI